jgi:hypothetical protein
MKKIYSSLVTKSYGFMAKALFVVFGMLLWTNHELKAQEITLIVTDYTGIACMTQGDLDAAFTIWLNSAVATVTGECEIDLITYDATEAPPVCGGSVVVTWTATSTCDTDTLIETRTFTVTPPAVDLTVPLDLYRYILYERREPLNTEFYNLACGSSI